MSDIVGQSFLRAPAGNPLDGGFRIHEDSFLRISDKAVLRAFLWWAALEVSIAVRASRLR